MGLLEIILFGLPVYLLIRWYSKRAERAEAAVADVIGTTADNTATICQEVTAEVLRVRAEAAEAVATAYLMGREEGRNEAVRVVQL